MELNSVLVAEQNNYRQQNGNLPSTSSGICSNTSNNNTRTMSIWTLTLNESFDTLRKLVSNRVAVENILDTNNQICKMYENTLNVYRLPKNPTELEHLIKKQKEQRTYVVRVLVKMEMCYDMSVEIGPLREILNDWDEVLIHLIELRYTEKLINEKQKATPYGLLQNLTETIGQTSSMMRATNDALLNLLSLINQKLITNMASSVTR